MHNRLLWTVPVGIALTAAAIPAFVFFGAMHPPLGARAEAANLFDGGSDQARITSAVKHDKLSVVALDVYVDGTRYVPIDPFGDTAPQTVQGRASGSGFVYDSNGTIVTNAHVISPPRGGRVEKIDVVFENGDHIAGHVTSVDRNTDLALVKVDNYAKLPAPLPLGDSKKLEAGQWAIAIGEPFELRQTVTVGVVSGFDRSEPIGDENGGQHTFTGLLQTSAPINPGNSGGPLIDMEGRVIGINQSVAGGAQGIGFAIPVDTVRSDVTAMLTGKGPANASADAKTAFVGVQLAPLTALRSQLNFTGDSGVAVQAVTAGGPADTSGVQPGDVITQIDGRAVTSPQDAVTAIHAHAAGQTVHLKIWRAGTINDVAVQTTPAPTQVGMTPEQASPDESTQTRPNDGAPETQQNDAGPNDPSADAQQNDPSTDAQQNETSPGAQQNDSSTTPDA